MAKVAIIGLGNIGSQTVDLLARLPATTELILVDPDLCEADNMSSQRIAQDAVDRAKVEVHAEHVRAIRPEIRTRVFQDEIANVPQGLFSDCDALLGCLDSRRARQDLNRIAWRLGKPLVDGGISPAHGLARVSVYTPGENNPCLLCEWNDEDYARLEQKLACGGETVRPTHAPAYLGAIVAALQVAEYSKLLGGEDAFARNRRIVHNVSTHEVTVCHLRRKASCRFDHFAWRLETLDAKPEHLTLAQAFRLAASRGTPALSVEGHGFVQELVCLCGHARRTLHLEHRLPEEAIACSRCGADMTPVGFETVYSLRASEVSPSDLVRPLSDFGFRGGDVLTISGGNGARHFVMPVDEMRGGFFSGGESKQAGAGEAVRL